MKKYILTLFLSMLCNLSFSKDMELTDPDVICTQTISLSGKDWRIAIDSENTGRQKAWFKTPPISHSRQTPVPWVIQDIFHDYHGVAWYWREFDTPKNLHTGGRYLLKFHAVDYLADVWVNGKHVGDHEGSETPFDMDVTDVLNSKGKNLLVVRVLNPTYEPIDGITLKDTPSGAKQYPVGGNSYHNSGGIIGDVELLVVPAVRVSDLAIIADWESGQVKIRAILFNAMDKEISPDLSFKVSETRKGQVAALKTFNQKIGPGINTIEADLQVSAHKLWSPDDPVLYRAEISMQALASIDHYSARFGFRDFRFENGYFRLNGERIFLKGTFLPIHYPVGYTVPLNEDMLRRDVVNVKALGFNFVRIAFGCPIPRILDIYDELGILVMQEHYGSWQLGKHGGYEFPKPENWGNLVLTRFENSIREVILRDRNHASVVMWGLLNESSDDMVFRKAVDLLPTLRTLDPSRLFVLNSGRFDRVKEIGSMSNPGSMTWDIGFDELYDWHPYRNIPFSPETLDELSGRSNISDQKFFITEGGLCSPINLPSILGDYQQWGKEQSDDARYFKREYEKFLGDWTKFNLGDTWSRPEDYIKDAYITANSLRKTHETAIRSNPHIVAYSPTASGHDRHGGSGVWTNFRRLKPELISSVLLANSSLRWCLSTEPQSIYRGDQIQLRVSFSNLDVLKPGKYPATIQVFDPDMKSVYDKKIFVNIAETKDGQEPPFAQTVLEEDITINGPAGKYQFLARLDYGGTAMGGKKEFYVSDNADFPEMPAEVVVIGTDSVVINWLKEHKVKILPFNDRNRSKRQVILICGEAPDSTTMLGIAGQMARGSVVIFLSPSTFSSGNNTTRWLPLVNKGRIAAMDAVAGYFRADRWAKSHPVFDGMPSGGMMDYKYFRNIISVNGLSQEYAVVAKSGWIYHEAPGTPLTYPSEAICGATRISHTYCSGVHVGAWDFGRGRFIVNTLHIGENLGKDPAADRLFCNMLNYASRDINKPMEKLPENFNQHLIEIGYKK